MTVYKWDKSIPGNNATADATINWSEGQSSATVNDSARAMMTAVAKYRDDIAGRTTTGGGPGNYTLTSNQGFSSLAVMDGAMVAFVMNVTCSTPVQLNVDGLGLKPLRATPSIELIAGQLVAGTPYAATYFNSTNQWILQGVPDLSGVTTAVIPIGGLLQYVGTSAPSSNFAMCNGQRISRTTFATLFAIVGTAYGVGDGSTTFNVPDLRGRVAAGQDNMSGGTGSPAQPFPIGTLTTDGGIIVGTTLGSFGGSVTHQQTTGELFQHSHPVVLNDPGHVHAVKTSQVQVGAGGTFEYMDGTGVFSTKNTNSSGSNGTGININGTQGAGNSNLTGNSNAMAWLQPTLIVNSIIRIL